MKQPVITVIGSLNMDLLTTISRLPDQGETNFGESFYMKPGGKGANQAVAAARLGAKVSLIGKVGNDSIGVELIQHMKRENVDTGHIGISKTKATGVANILINESDNRIMVVSGANQEVTPDYAESCKETLLASDVVLSQLEVPVETVEWAADFCHKNEIPFVLNPAPAVPLSASVWEKCSYITPNELEAALLFQEPSFSDQLITTLGPLGAKYKTLFIPGYPAEVVDTTGAGDTFNGALAFSLGVRLSVEQAIAFANAAASFTVEKLGAQAGMPTYEKVEERMGLNA
ncbi:ribokinase [Halobacillus sp. Marseille-Q1614]|uniref:ribokinase n=1 Tax=Halobacillus sp. Marseille-Q1614 TaxID=2709134 RepID=UPI00156D9D9A|nr:ribokinase [Halobacillus sp. Marseille-Q1614]